MKKITKKAAPKTPAEHVRSRVRAAINTIRGALELDPKGGPWWHDTLAKGLAYVEAELKLGLAQAGIK